MTPTASLRPNLIEAAALAMSCTLAFALATWAGFAHPYWAPMSVWVVAQPYRDHVFQRGWLRVAGTAIGALSGFAILYAGLSTQTTLVVACLWIGLVAASQNLWSGPARYIGFMAAMTTAVVVLPNLLAVHPHPDVALERVICVLIGVVVTVAILGFVSLPNPNETARVRLRDRFTTAVNDLSRASRTAFVVGLGTLALGLTGILAGLPAAELSALGFAIFASVLGGLPHPRGQAPVLALGVACGILAAIVYRLLVLPMVASEALAVLSLIPFFIVGALARSTRNTAAPALDANMCFLLIAQGTMAASTAPSVVLTDAASIAVAAVLAAGAAMLFLPDRA